MDGQTDGQADRQMDRQNEIGKDADRQTGMVSITSEPKWPNRRIVITTKICVIFKRAHNHSF